MSLTEDQRYFMDILETAGFVRTAQVLPLLRINEPRKELNHAEAMLRRLRYLGRLILSSEGLICLPELRNTPPDPEMLLSLDILLTLRPGRLLRVSLQQPYKLCFLVQRADGWIDYFAVMPVPVGHGLDGAQSHGRTESWKHEWSTLIQRSNAKDCWRS